MNLVDKSISELIKKLNEWNNKPTRLWHPNFNNPYETSIIKLKEQKIVYMFDYMSNHGSKIQREHYNEWLHNRMKRKLRAKKLKRILKLFIMTPNQVQHHTEYLV